LSDNAQSGGDGDHSVFISFSSHDRRTAKLVCKELEKHGLRCWISSRDVQPGENYQSAIVRAIKSAKVVIVLFTAHANHSDEIKKEISLASRFKAAVIPVRVEDVSMDEAFSYELATRQWVDAFKGWEMALENLAEAAHAYIRLQGGSSIGAVKLPYRPRRSIDPARLRELERLSAAREQIGSAPAATATPVLPVAPAARGTPLPNEGQAAIQAALAAYLGPIARVLVQKYATDAKSLPDLVDKVAGEIPTLEARAVFKRECARILA